MCFNTPPIYKISSQHNNNVSVFMFFSEKICFPLVPNRTLTEVDSDNEIATEKKKRISYILR